MKLLITGGAGFIGSNLVDHFLEQGHEIVCLDDLSTGFEKNICHHFNNQRFTFIKGDIREFATCRKAVEKCDYVSHQAALGSVPRSIADPSITNSVNISGFLNVLIASRDAKVKRFVYAASSSTYGASKKLPKVEDEIGKPLSPYAVTKYINELYAEVFANTYGMQCIGLRYFNVFGKRQEPNGAYAAVIPLWFKSLINHNAPLINGDGSNSRDFTYIENVIQANEKALFKPTEEIQKNRQKYYKSEIDFSSQHNNSEFDTRKYYTETDTNKKQLDVKKERFSEVVNIAYGGNTTLIQLLELIKKNLSKYDGEVGNIKPEFGPMRAGDISHSYASVLKAKIILDYNPVFDLNQGLNIVTDWYIKNEKIGIPG